MNKLIKRLCAVALIILGIIGLALPFLQGIALIVAGLLLFDSKWSQSLLMRIRSWLPALKQKKK